MIAELETIPPLDEIDKALAETSLAEFMRQAWHLLEPETEYLHNWHIDAIADYLQAVSAGQITRLLINMPPRYLKSTTVTIMWPAWTWIRQPAARFIAASYAASLSTQHSIARREVIESEWYQSRWGDRFELSVDQNAKSHFSNDRRGEMLSTSMTGLGGGFGCDYFITDDPHNIEKADSDAERKTAIKAYRQKFTRRLNDKKKSAMVIVMQRLHADDLSAHALNMGYVHLCLEGISPKRRFILLPSSLPAGHPIVCDCAICTEAAKDKAKKEAMKPPPEEVPPAQGQYYEREKGEYLHAEREGQREHAEARKELLSAGYAKQYDQRPSPEEGTKFKRIWFQYFSDKGDHYELHHRSGKIKRFMKKDCKRFATADTAMSEEKTADYTAIGVWALTPEFDLLLLDMIREKIEDPDVDRLLRGLISSGRILYLAIETKANGKSLFQRFVSNGLPVKELHAESDKVTRATLASIDMENGKTYFLADANWLGDYEKELTEFPNGLNDDQVDATSYASIEKGQDLLIGNPNGPVSPVAG